MSICRNCVHALWARTANGRLHPNGQGRCDYPMPVIEVPAVISGYYAKEPQPFTVPISNRYIERNAQYPAACAKFSTTKTS